MEIKLLIKALDDVAECTSGIYSKTTREAAAKAADELRAIETDLLAGRIFTDKASLAGQVQLPDALALIIYCATNCATQSRG